MIVSEDYVGASPLLACNFETWLASLAAAGLAGHLFLLWQQWCGALAMACVAALYSVVVAVCCAFGAWVFTTMAYICKLVAIIVFAEAILIISIVLAPFYGYLFCFAGFAGICTMFVRFGLHHVGSTYWSLDFSGWKLHSTSGGRGWHPC